ncbi:hypothetical protein GTR02_17920 [Kineococcus sp. R8]|uniref:hypothetical protein n=1 Tax=Kineococcus siccus TaxID=2696567 RepID=UPI0014126D96|nr:hypothetical protein [Kineococcus siccus]NAZ83693.1 hypothetical protein [Kineococcus siccus]
MQEEAPTLGARGTRRGLALAGLLLGLLALDVWWRGERVAPVLVAYVGAAAVCIVHTVVRHRLDTVRLERESIVVLTRAGERAYAWADVLEVSWSTPSRSFGGSGPVLRLRGGPFDVPGPNAPAQVAHLPVFGRRATQEAVALLRRVTESHGLTYTPGLVELIDTGKRMPRLPGESRGPVRRPR